MGYPNREAELAILEAQGGRTHTADDLQPVAHAADVADASTLVDRACTSRPSSATYVLDLVDASRRHPDLMLGVSPRGSLAIQRAARALAASHGRTFVIPDDVKRVVPVRSSSTACSLAPDAQLRGVTERRRGRRASSRSVPVPGADRRLTRAHPCARLDLRRVTLTRRGWSLVGAATRARRRQLPARHRRDARPRRGRARAAGRRSPAWLAAGTTPRLAVAAAGEAGPPPRRRPTAGSTCGSRTWGPRRARSSSRPTGSTKGGARRGSSSRRSRPVRTPAPRTGSRPAAGAATASARCRSPSTDPFGLARRTLAERSATARCSCARASTTSFAPSSRPAAASRARATCRRRGRW